MRYLGLDYGRKRLGIALSDPLGIFAQPHCMIPRDSRSIEAIAKIVEEMDVAELVIGLPLPMERGVSDMADEVKKFAENLGKRISRPIHYWDERLTTAESEKFLISAEVRREKRKEVRDQVAAALILQGFLQSRTSG